MRELLERSLLNYELPPALIAEIETELSRPVEPVAWMYTDSTGTVFENSGDTDHGWIPLFTHPPAKPVLLSDTLIKEMWNDEIHYNSFARAIEQAVLKANGIGGVE